MKNPQETNQTDYYATKCIFVHFDKCCFIPDPTFKCSREVPLMGYKVQVLNM